MNTRYMQIQNPGIPPFPDGDHRTIQIALAGLAQPDAHGDYDNRRHNHANGKVLTLEVELCGSVSRHHSHERTHQSGNTRVDQG